jgi:hypothetical protein
MKEHLPQHGGTWVFSPCGVWRRNVYTFYKRIIIFCSGIKITKKPTEAEELKKIIDEKQGEWETGWKISDFGH